MTSTRTIEGIRLIARDTQKIKIFDKVAYAFGSSAVMDLLNEVENYLGCRERQFYTYERACVEYGHIDVDALEKKANELAENNEDIDKDELFYEMFDEAIEDVNPPMSKIMECILDEVGYYHQVQLYDGTEWYNEIEIDLIDYDEGEKGTFTLKEVEK